MKIRFEFVRIRLNLKYRGGEAATAHAFHLVHTASLLELSYCGHAQTFCKPAFNRIINNVSYRL